MGSRNDTIAGWLGIKLSDDGIPCINESGIAFNHVVYPLWRQGIVAAHLVSTRHPRAADLARCPEITLPSPADRAAILQGQTAVIGAEYTYNDEPCSDHCFAWINDRAVIEHAWWTDDGVKKHSPGKWSLAQSRTRSF